MRRREKNYRNAAYNYTSQAFKYDDYSYEEGRSKRRSKRTKTKTVVSSGVRRDKAKQQTLMYRIKNFSVDFRSLRIGFGVLVIFIYAMMFLNMLAVRNDQSNNMTRLREELASVEENNIYMENQLAKNTDLNRVEKIASTKLGMQKPSNHQIVYIDVPKQSYTVQYNKNKNNTEAFSLTKIVENFLKE